MSWKIIGDTSDEVGSWRAPSRRGNYLGVKRATPLTHTHKVGSDMLVAVTYKVVMKKTTETYECHGTQRTGPRGEIHQSDRMLGTVIARGTIEAELEPRT